MTTAPRPLPDMRRAAALIAREPPFEMLTTGAARLLDVALVRVAFSAVDPAWFMARYGSALPPTPSDVPLCSQVVASGEPRWISDATHDPSFADSPLIVAGARVRSYAAVPLRTPDGFVLGSRSLHLAQHHRLHGR